MQAIHLNTRHIINIMTDLLILPVNFKYINNSGILIIFLKKEESYQILGIHPII